MRTRTKVIAGGAAGLFALAALLGGGAPDVLEVKGLRLGMPIEEAARVMAGHGFEVGGGSKPWDGKSDLKLEEGLFSTHVLRGGGWAVAADGERRVEAIEIAARALDRLFGAGDMSAEEFAASFASAYGVPLEPTAQIVDPEIAALTGDFLKAGWACVNREAGWAVKVSDHKVLEIMSINPASRQSFD